MFHFYTSWKFHKKTDSGGIYLLKVNNRNTRARCQIYSKLTIKTPERRHWCRSGVFIVNFEHISHLVPVFLLLTMNMQLPAWVGYRNGASSECSTVLLNVLLYVQLKILCPGGKGCFQRFLRNKSYVFADKKIKELYYFFCL